MNVNRNAAIARHATEYIKLLVFAAAIIPAIFNAIIILIAKYFTNFIESARYRK
jgi:preprotein translocase subunit SecY